jgi:hypothetical protein
MAGSILSELRVSIFFVTEMDCVLFTFKRNMIMFYKKLIFWSLCLAFLCLQGMSFAHKAHQKRQLVYYLYIQDFLNSMIVIPTSPVNVNSSTIGSKYFAGIAPIYKAGDVKFGVCSASFLCMQNQHGIFTDISNYLMVDNGLIVSWLTPSTLVNLELDSIIHGMVTECIVTASTKVGFNPFYGMQFNMVVSADSQRIYFNLTPL